MEKMEKKVPREARHGGVQQYPATRGGSRVGPSPDPGPLIFKNIFTLSHVPEHGHVLDQGGVVHGVLLTTGEALAIKPKSPLAHFLTMSSLL